MKHLSTHVLDLARGKPAADVPVRLEKQDASGTWQPIASASTDHDGRCGQLLSAEESSPGTYRLVFDTGSYFRATNTAGLYPVVEVTFEVRDSDSRFHIPLLLSPNGYTTYRGS